MLFFLPKFIRRLVYLSVLLTFLSAGDVLVRVWAGNQVEQRANEAWNGAATTDVSFSGFPFVGRLVVSGEVTAMRVRLRQLAGHDITFAVIGIDLHGIQIDRNAFVRDRNVRLDGLDSGTAFAEILDDEVSRILGVPVQFEPGRAIVTVAGRDVSGSVAVREGRLVITPQAGPQLVVTIPTADYLPCVADGTVLSGRIRVSCTITEIPAPLVRAASDVATG